MKMLRGFNLRLCGPRGRWNIKEMKSSSWPVTVAEKATGCNLV